MGRTISAYINNVLFHHPGATDRNQHGMPYSQAPNGLKPFTHKLLTLKKPRRYIRGFNTMATTGKDLPPVWPTPYPLLSGCLLEITNAPYGQCLIAQKETRFQALG